MYLSWIIPAYNEERRIGKTLAEVDAYLKARNFPGGAEIIVANSASRDQTVAIAEGMRNQIANLHIVNVVNRGKGWAVKEAMLAAKGDIRLFSDADNSTSPESFDAMAPMFQQGYDIVISSRDPKDAKGASRDVKEPWYREILGNAGNMVIQIFGVWGIWDTQNGFKAFRAVAAENIFLKTLIPGFAFDIEVLAIARSLGYRIGIVPIRWVFDPDSKVTLKAYLQVFLDVFRIRWNFIAGKYSRLVK